MQDLCGKLPEGVIGLNKTACLSNAVNAYLTNRTRWADAEGNDLIDKLVEIGGGGDMAVLQKVVVDKMKSETDWRSGSKGRRTRSKAASSARPSSIVFPDYLLRQHSHVCLSTLVATELGLDTEALAKNNKIALRLVERTHSIPHLPSWTRSRRSSPCSLGRSASLRRPRDLITIELPSSVVTFSATLYLSQLVARQLDLTSMKKGDKIAATLRLQQRTTSSPRLPPFLGSLADERVLAQYDIEVETDTATIILSWPQGHASHNFARSDFINMIRKHAGEATLQAVWSQRPPRFASWPVSALEKPDDMSVERWVAASAASGGSLTRQREEINNKRSEHNDNFTLFKQDGAQHFQQVLRPSPPHAHLVWLGVDAKGDVWYALRTIGDDFTSDVTWHRLTLKLSKVMKVFINDCLRLHGLAPKYNVKGPLREARKAKSTEEQVVDELVSKNSVKLNKTQIKLLGTKIKTPLIKEGKRKDPERLRIDAAASVA